MGMEIRGMLAVQKALKEKLKQANKANAVVQVGYTMKYALPVHERRKGIAGERKEGKERNTKGQFVSNRGAKYLEKPAREQAGEIARIVVQAAQKTGDIRRGLVLGGLRLQRESQKLVPIDTGALRASAYTREEVSARDTMAATLEARARGEEKRTAAIEARMKAKAKAGK